MALRLLDAGFPLTVYDTNADAVKPLAARGAKAAASAEEVASAADIVLMSLPTPPIVQAVSVGEGGILRGSRLKTLIDLSTTGPERGQGRGEGGGGAQRRVGGFAGQRRRRGRDEGHAGGDGVVRRGRRSPVVDPLLKTFGKTFYVGEKPGLAQIAKLANNLLAAAAIVVSSEAVAMGVKAGLDAKVLIDIINAGSGRNSATQDKFPRAILTRTFDFGFATGLSYKDVRLCIDEAEALGVPMVAGAAVRQMLAITQARFGADSDFTSIAKVVEEWAGVEIK